MDQVKKGSLKRVRLLPEDWVPESEPGTASPTASPTAGAAVGDADAATDAGTGADGDTGVAGGPEVTPTLMTGDIGVIGNPAPLKRIRKSGPQLSGLEKHGVGAGDILSSVRVIARNDQNDQQNDANEGTTVHAEVKYIRVINDVIDIINNDDDVNDVIDGKTGSSPCPCTYHSRSRR